MTDLTPEEARLERRKQQKRDAVARYRARHPEKVRAQRATYRAANRDDRRKSDREASRRWREANLEKVRAIARKYAENNREAARIRSAEWRKANPEKAAKAAIGSRARRKDRWAQFLKQERLRYHSNPDGKLAKQKDYRADPSVIARMAVYQREYAKLHPEKAAIANAKRRAAKLHATPAWADIAALEEIYRKARRLTEQTGIPHEVDHIIPLRGRGVRGLHVLCNLQILTRTENRQKFIRLSHAVEASQ